MHEGIEVHLLLEDVVRGGPRRLGLQREVHALVTPVLLRMAGGDALEADTEAQPPHGEFAEAIQGMRRRERHAVVGPDRLRPAKLLKRALEDAEGVPLLRRGQRFAGQQVARGVVGDRQRIAVPLIAEPELALVVGAPEAVGVAGRRPRGPGQPRPAAPTAMGHQAMAVEHGVHGADRGGREVGPALAQALPNLGLKG